MKETDNNLDSQLWHACAGNMVNMPSINSKVFYFPQGYAEHAQAHVDFATHLRIPSLILCRVLAVKFMADPETDEVFAKIKMVPIGNNELDLDENGDMGFDGSENLEKPSSFAKTLTQSDANNGGGFSVPRYCAETIFPRLDYSADPPVQTIIAKDVHGEIWKFRHIYRGTPRRHLLTTGWSSFVNQKKLVAGDSIVFLRSENGDLCVGIRRAKRGIGFGNDSNESSSGWSSFCGFSMFLKEDENKVMRNGFGNSSSCGENLRVKGRVRVEDVVEASNLAINGQPFAVVYYPRGSTPEFCVKAEAVKTAMRIQWCSGMRFKMPFETEDSSRISWFMGTIASVQVADPIRWPNSPWRLLQVTWDEPDLLQNVKRVSPWLVELVTNMPVIQMSPFSPPKKKSRLLQHPDFTTFDGQFPVPSFSGKPLGPSSPLCYYLADNTPAGIQGARHARFGISLTDLHLRNKLQPGLCPTSFQLLNQHSRISNGIITGHRNSHESLSCLLTMGNSSQNLKKSDGVKKHHFLLFGQPILTEQQMSRSSSSDTTSQVVSGKDLVDRNPNRAKFLSEDSGSSLELRVSPEKSSAGFSWHCGQEASELGLDTGHCKVFMESEDVGRTLNLSTLGSYEELHRRLASMFGVEILEMPNRVIYRDSSGVLKQTGDEPFSEFRKTAKRLTVLADSHSTSMGRTLIAGIRNAESGLDSSSKAGPLSIFA